MKKRKSTLRILRPLAKRIAQVANDIDRANRSLHSLSALVHDIEFRLSGYEYIEAKAKQARTKIDGQIDNLDNLEGIFQ